MITESLAVVIVTAPPAPPLSSPPFASLPLAMTSAPVEKVIVDVLVVVSSVTEPASFPALLLEAAPPEVVISPSISMCPVVAPEPGFLETVLILTDPPSVSLLPVVTIVVELFDLNEPELYYHLKKPEV